MRVWVSYGLYGKVGARAPCSRHIALRGYEDPSSQTPVFRVESQQVEEDLTWEYLQRQALKPLMRFPQHP